MRIIGGSHKGRTIQIPRNFRGRPTTDFAREGLFNMLHSEGILPGSDVLDLFAGTGAFGLECLSRGASNLLAVDLNQVHVSGIRENLSGLGMTGQVQRADVFRFLTLPPSRTYDIVFADPPFDHPQLSSLPRLVCEGGWLKEGGLFVLEHPAQHSFEGEPVFEKHRAFGNVHFSFFRP